MHIYIYILSFPKKMVIVQIFGYLVLCGVLFKLVLQYAVFSNFGLILIIFSSNMSIIFIILKKLEF